MIVLVRPQLSQELAYSFSGCVFYQREVECRDGAWGSVGSRQSGTHFHPIISRLYCVHGKFPADLEPWIAKVNTWSLFTIMLLCCINLIC